jgi:hypothetical protein
MIILGEKDTRMAENTDERRIMDEVAANPYATAAFLYHCRKDWPPGFMECLQRREFLDPNCCSDSVSVEETQVQQYVQSAS